MRGNTVTLHLTYGRVAQTGNLWQFDYGQRLILAGVALPPAYEVHFANAETGNSKTVIGDSTGVDIPDEYLLTGDKIHVWIYLHDGESDGETEYHGIINVSKRARPTDQEPTPVQQSEIDQAIAALNAGISTVEEIAEGIPQTIDTALEEAKESGEFDGKDGDPGKDGVSPVITVTDITGGHRVTITDATGSKTVDVMDGEPGTPGNPGQPGADGVSPTVAVSSITDGHRVTITDKTGPHAFDVMDGEKGDPGDPGDPTELIDDNISPSDPKYNKKTFSAQKIDSTVSNLNTAISAKYTKPSGGIPASDLASGVIPAVPVQDVQVNGVSVLNQGVANVPIASSSTPGVISPSGALYMTNNKLAVDTGSDSQIKAGAALSVVIAASKQHLSTFYGLAKAAGADMAFVSGATVGVYPEAQKSAISDMLNAPETVSGTTPSITAKSGVRYVCGEVSTLTITAPASGCIDVVFESGSTPTVLTVSSAKTGVTAIKWANGFDPTSLDADTTYEINILDGEFGVVGSWT